MPESSRLCRNVNSDLYRCGADAANKLASFTSIKTVSCTSVDRDRYGRIVARCSVGAVDVAGVAGPVRPSAGLALVVTWQLRRGAVERQPGPGRVSGPKRGRCHGSTGPASAAVVARRFARTERGRAAYSSVRRLRGADGYIRFTVRPWEPATDVTYRRLRSHRCAHQHRLPYNFRKRHSLRSAIR